MELPERRVLGSSAQSRAAVTPRSADPHAPVLRVRYVGDGQAPRVGRTLYPNGRVAVLARKLRLPGVAPGLPQHFYRLPTAQPRNAESPLFPRSFRESGRHDSNMRPPGPKPGALARLSYAPMTRDQLAKTGSRSAVGKYTGSAGTREGVPANRLKLADQSVMNSSSRSNSSGLANGITIRPAPLLLA